MSSRSDGGSEPDGRIFGRDMGMLCASRFFFFSGHNAILVMLAPFLVGRGADPAQAGLAVGAAGVVSIASRLVAGWWSDQHGRKPILVIGALITAAVAFSYGYVQSYNSVLALRMLEGIAGGAFLTTTWTLAAMLTPSGRRGEAFGLFTVVSSMAIGAAPLVAIFLESRWGFRAVFSVASLCFILALVCVVILRDRPAVPLPTGAATSYKGMLRPGVLIPSLAGASAMFVHGGVQAFLILFAAQRGIVHAGLFFTIYSLIGLCSRVFVGRAGDRFGIRTVTLPSLFILSVGLFLLGTARSLPALVFAAVIYGLGFAAVNPLV
ncbi:MAG: MFS transporter, partial [Firmicutes bacterium]|nr:MFS transporter [Bacillota bacterium]